MLTDKGLKLSLNSLLVVVIGALMVLTVYVRFRLPVEDIAESSRWRKTDHSPSKDHTTRPHMEFCGEEKRHVVFIKVHKAGSSTIANILFRFGISRNLTFLMPARDVTVSLHLSQPWRNILPVPPGADHYDILSNHAVYEKSEIKRLFPSDSVIIAVLRKPMGQLESSMYYYYSKQYDGHDDKVGAYLKNPELLRSDRYINNSMAYELGVPRQQFFNESFVRAHAEVISKEIDFIMILERLDESLVLLKRRLCWKLQDIIYIIRNVNKKKPHVQTYRGRVGEAQGHDAGTLCLVQLFLQKTPARNFSGTRTARGSGTFQDVITTCQ
ncbi:galactose-3-O-sulfotransferase 2-like [Liolophura sinensis]|uniref:galactose-3-O-sulfotransferase 2-like n=1 Tax=Liolophura sinensis TaxID=3198878 RepID=UPI003158DDEC